MAQPEVWGHGSIVAFLVIVAILLVGPWFMGPISPPSFPLLLIFPIVMAAVLIFLMRATR
ncbi:putative transmembrane protein [Senna tora]|uniref:Putative transmembrane protein n=1 Tax=Senna tora TaxID=362788 RepID=A0A834SI53_9FABA|nr:putative transmembrane protein [Senna tora]